MRFPQVGTVWLVCFKGLGGGTTWEQTLGGPQVGTMEHHMATKLAIVVVQLSIFASMWTGLRNPLVSNLMGNQVFLACCTELTAFAIAAEGSRLGG